MRRIEASIDTVLLVAGALVVIGSFMTWDVCGKEPCEGAGGLFHLYMRSGLELGVGFVTAVLGALLALFGTLDRRRTRRFPLVVPLIAVGILAVLAGYFIRVHLIPEYRVSGPSLGFILAALGGVIAFAASLRSVRRAD